jgi:hypothetical protein
MRSTLFSGGVTILSWLLALQSIPAHAGILPYLGGKIEGPKELHAHDSSSLTGYLGAFFLGSDPYVYFYLSDGNNPLSFKALNKGSPILKPTKGTGGVRDPAIVRGGGNDAGKKWYIVGTDLDIGKVRA